MPRRAFPFLALLTVAGCGGAGQSTMTSMSPSDPTMRTTGNAGNGTATDTVFKPTVGANTPLGTLKALAPTSPLAKAPAGKVDKDGAAKLAKLGKEGLKLDDAYGYTVADATAPQATVGEKGASVPLPTEAKANPDGTYWVVDAETRRVFTILGVKREADKPATATEAPSGDLVHPTADAPVPPLALVARAEEATTGMTHALRILAKGVGGEGAPADGARVRLKKGVSEKELPLLVKAVVRGLKKYGAVLAPGEGVPALSVLADPRWTKEDEKAMEAVHMTDFEIVAPVAKPASPPKKK